MKNENISVNINDAVGKSLAEVLVRNGIKQNSKTALRLEAAFLAGAQAVLNARNESVPPLWVICNLSGRSILTVPVTIKGNIGDAPIPDEPSEVSADIDRILAEDEKRA